MDEKLLTGVDLIAAERTRQIEEEGWSPEHDDGHTEGELALVGALYATPLPLFTVSVTDECKHEEPGFRGITLEADDPWPCDWSKQWDKRGKHSRLIQLTVAGALIAAEIDRLIRKDGFTCCPYCSSDVIYQDRVDAQKGVAHCDDCGQEIPGEVYRQIVGEGDNP